MQCATFAKALQSQRLDKNNSKVVGYPNLGGAAPNGHCEKWERHDGNIGCRRGPTITPRLPNVGAVLCVNRHHRRSTTWVLKVLVQCFALLRASKLAGRRETRRRLQRPATAKLVMLNLPTKRFFPVVAVPRLRCLVAEVVLPWLRCTLLLGVDQPGVLQGVPLACSAHRRP